MNPRCSWKPGSSMALALGALAVSLESAGGQDLERFSLEESLACFEESRRASKNISECESAVVEIEFVIMEPERYAVVYESVLDGLEKIALTSNHLGVEIGAVAWLATAGELEAAPPAVEIVSRLGVIYRDITDPTLRSGIAQRLVRQRDESAAVELLTEIAQDNQPVDSAAEFPPAAVAIGALTEMGTAGVAALERLHSQGTVRNPQARYKLERLAENGFRDPGPRR